MSEIDAQRKIFQLFSDYLGADAKVGQYWRRDSNAVRQRDEAARQIRAIPQDKKLEFYNALIAAFESAVKDPPGSDGYRSAFVVGFAVRRFATDFLDRPQVHKLFELGRI